MNKNAVRVGMSVIGGGPFAGYVGRVVRVSKPGDSHRRGQQSRTYVWVLFPGHPWQADDLPFSFEPRELTEA